MAGLIILSLVVLINHYYQIFDTSTVHKLFVLGLLTFAAVSIFYLAVLSKEQDSGKHEVVINPSGKINVDGYQPNKVAASIQIFNFIISVILISYGTYGILSDDIYIPGRSKGVHFNGFSAWLVYVSFIFASCTLFSVIVDHYDKRNNERIYIVLSKTFSVLGWSCFLLALFVKFFFK